MNLTSVVGRLVVGVGRNGSLDYVPHTSIQTGMSEKAGRQDADVENLRDRQHQASVVLASKMIARLTNRSQFCFASFNS